MAVFGMRNELENSLKNKNSVTSQKERPILEKMEDIL
jgi:hypothetical protein